MTSSMNRRNAMIGLAALSSAPAAAALATVAKAASNPDTGLIAACEEWLAQECKVVEMFDISGKLSDEARAKEPALPTEPSEELDLPPHGRRGPDDGKPWDANNLRKFVTEGKTFHCEKRETGDDSTVIETAWHPVPDATRARAAELLAIHERHEVAVRAVWAKHDAAQEAADDFASEQWRRLVEICALPALTIAGLNAKARVIAAGNAFETADGDVGQNILADIEQLAASV